MAGENVVASGAIAVDINLHGFEEGATPNAPGAAGPPRTVGGVNRDAADYFTRKKRDASDERNSLKNLNKFLPMLGGAFGIAELVRQSGIIKGYLGAVFGLLGAIVDLALLPLVPLFNKVIQGWSYIVNGFAVIMTDPLRALKNIENFLRAIKEFFFGVPRLETQHTKDVLGDKYRPFVPDDKWDKLAVLLGTAPYMRKGGWGNTIINNVLNFSSPSLWKNPWENSEEQIKAAMREGTNQALNDVNWERSGG